MIILITQPTFLPWLGYFDQIRIADKIVLLDSVQYARRSWQNRNRLTNQSGKEIMITLPLKKAPRETKIKDIEVSKSFNLENLLKTIKSSYLNAENIEESLSIIKKSFKKNTINNKVYLREINRQFIENVCNLGSINHDITWSSDLEEKISYNTPTERLLEICKLFSAKTYLSAPGAKDYMANEGFKFRDSNIKIQWHSFNQVSYLNKGFKPYMSVVDYISHIPIKKLKNYLAMCSTI